jgi:hypothetical protein
MRSSYVSQVSEEAREEVEHEVEIVSHGRLLRPVQYLAPTKKNGPANRRSVFQCTAFQSTIVLYLVRLFRLAVRRALGACLRSSGGRGTLLDVLLHVALEIVDVLILRTGADQ